MRSLPGESRMVCRALGYIASSLVGIVFLLSLVGLSSCTLVPGMHMRNRGFSPSVNQQDEIVTPKINFITPALIQTQRAEERAQRNIAAKTYQIPQGFSTDTAGYV